MSKHKNKILQEINGYIGMLIGCVAYGSSTSLFLARNEIIAGGASGLAVLINYLNPALTVGLMLLCINLPILLLGIKYQGWKFILRCLLTVATLSLVTDLLAKAPLMTEDTVLASLYGGICQGIGLGLFVRFQFSSGGTELLGRIMTRFVKGLNIPVCVGILDGLIVVLGAIFTKNPDNMLYALIVVFVSTKVSEIVLVGLEKSKLCIIITDKGQEISDTLLHNSPRGITMLSGQGMYTNKEHDVLLTCVKNRQLTQLRNIVKGIDEHAFIIINDAAEVRGQGFQSLQQ